MTAIIAKAHRSNFVREVSTGEVGMAHHTTWALVTDGVRARIVRDLEGASIPPISELISRAGSGYLLDLLSDPAALAGDANSGEQCSLTAAGAHAIHSDMQEFALVTLGQLQERFKAGAFERLAIFATPMMLSIIREVMPDNLKRTAVFESAVDLMWRSEADLRRKTSIVLNEGQGG